MNSFKQWVAGLAVLGAASAASATVVLPGSETSLQTVIDSLYSCATCTNAAFAPNVNTNQYMPDRTWALEASGGSVATIVLELAGNANTNTFGIYDINNQNQVQLFGGPADQADQATVSISANGSVLVQYMQRDGAGNFTNFGYSIYGAGYFTGSMFGYYLGTGGGTLYSDGARNAGGADQMVAFQGDGDTIKLPGNNAGQWGSSSYILAWEDTAYGSSDKDFNDFVVYVESVKGVPEPATLALLGSALAGVGFAARRRRNTSSK